jgi:hypothetical protein
VNVRGLGEEVFEVTADEIHTAVVGGPSADPAGRPCGGWTDRCGQTLRYAACAVVCDAPEDVEQQASRLRVIAHQNVRTQANTLKKLIFSA